MATKYYALLTNVGAAKLANATALGEQVEITQMAVGDGNGALPTPNPAQTALVHELRRAPLNTLTIDPVNTNQIIAEQVIPEDVGGWWIREIGLYDSAGDLIAIANCAETYKPLLQEGSGRVQVIRVILVVSSTQAVTLKIDPSVVLATRQYVDAQIIQVKAYVDQQLAAHIAATDPHKQYAPKASPAFTGKPTTPTAVDKDNSTQIANTAFVQAALAALVGSSPEALDTLNELAAALGNDPNFATTVMNELAGKMAIAKNGSDIADVAMFLQNLGMNTPRIATITSSKTITLPSWVTTIYVTACGGGGGGGAGGGGNATYFGGGGGGGGAGQSVYKKAYTITAGSSIAVTIGAGGSGANGTISAGATGTAGGSTIVGSLVSLSGGSPGVGGLNATSGNTVGGSSGGGGYPKGSDGGDCSLTYGGGNGGVGGSSPLGGGGSTGRAGTTNGAPGGTAGGYGGGGGGGGGKYSAVAGTGLGGDGGNGTPGIAIIEW